MRWDVELFDCLGFKWNRSVIPSDMTVLPVERVIFHFYRSLPEFVWNAGALEGNPITFVEVKTLLDGVTVGGRKVADAEQILNLSDSMRLLLERVKQGQFSLNKHLFCALHAIVARNEALEWGHFRGEGVMHDFSPTVTLGPAERYSPLPTVKNALNLNALFDRGLAAMHAKIPHPVERAIVFFLFGAYHKFFFDGNRRTSRLMMNGELRRSGFNAINIPFAQAECFNSAMVQFYRSGEATAMIEFLLSLYEE